MKTDLLTQALARAVYNRKPIVILDDILKGLDADTYAKCFTAILGPEGLLRKNRTAIVLATHNIQLLPYADHIIVLTDDGHIREKGSFDGLNGTDGSHIRSLGLKKSAMDVAAAVDAEEAELETVEKEKLLAKIQSAKVLDEEQKGASRGKRNADALVEYIKTMGNFYFILSTLR